MLVSSLGFRGQGESAVAADRIDLASHKASP